MSAGIWGVFGATAIVGGGVGLGLYGRQVWHHIYQLWLKTRPSAPTGPRLEELAGDLRRLRHSASVVPTGTSAARRQGTQLAYDDALLSACALLELSPEVTEPFASLPLGPDRDIARLVVEAELINQGLVLTPA